MDDEEVKAVLKQAFLSIENGFFDSIGDQLVEKTLIQEEIAGLTQYEAAQQFPEKVDKLRAIEQEVGSGTTAVVALIYNNKLFVTNVGNSRAVLCTTDSNGRIHVQQLSTDHIIGNENELIRLSNLGLDIEQIQRGPKAKIGNHESTRSIGDYTVKGGYKDFDILSAAKDEPVIAEPDSCGGILIDQSFYFLILMSDGLYKSLEVSKALSQEANVEIVGLVTTELQAQSTINGVCQAVVDRICRFHHDGFMNQNKQCERRDDMTLLLRLFSAQLGGQAQSPVSPLTTFHPFTGQNNLGFVHIPIPAGGMLSSSYAPAMAIQHQPQPPFSTLTGTMSMLPTATRTTLSYSTAHMPPDGQASYPGPGDQPLGLHDNTRDQTDDAANFVESYVDFSEYYKAIEAYGEDYVVNSVQLS